MEIRDAGMSREEASQLADQVRETTGLDDIEVGAQDGFYVVHVVTVSPGARNVFTLHDENDWDWLRPRIVGLEDPSGAAVRTTADGLTPETLADLPDDGGGRAELIKGLVGPGGADQACRRALEAGAVRSTSTERVAVAELVTIYGRRMRHLHDRGIPMIGSETAIARLKASGCVEVRLARIHSVEFDFVVFLDDVAGVVSSLGVAASTATPGVAWPGS
ncbi:hypothetical protein ACXR2U_13155 [Jatrophihabitans sp. YIM 134969]